MPNSKTDTTRSRISLDDFAPEEPPIADTKVLREVAKRSGFNAREFKAPDSPTAAPVRRTRRMTGRTYPFNTKLKPETYQKICDYSDLMSEEEDRPVSMAEVLERALDALDKKRAGQL